uniref:Glycosyl hydrolases family 38 C-terminal beta sandwich domain-containing protein n=1 Tax=Panagrolaimus sp. JU765 TaxID=591449 RepID=A0AC34QZE0_9BILA
MIQRNQGGASLVDGQVELMLHRRMYYDDHWGVEEALDEPGNDGQGLVVRGKHWLILEPAASSQKDQRKLALEMFHQPIVTFSLFQPGPKNSILTDFSGLLKQLPENIHVLTLKRLSESSVLLRLEHFLQNGDDTSLAQPAVVDLDQIFSTLDVLSVEELLLAANARTGNRKDMPLSWNRPSNILTGSGRERFAVQLQPMEIKTLLLEVRYRKPSEK